MLPTKTPRRAFFESEASEMSLDEGLESGDGEERAFSRRSM